MYEWKVNEFVFMLCAACFSSGLNGMIKTTDRMRVRVVFIGFGIVHALFIYLYFPLFLSLISISFIVCVPNVYVSPSRRIGETIQN